MQGSLFDEPEMSETPRTSLVCSDVLAWAETYTGEPMHACLCDPPYSLGNGTKGFMNKAWDTNIAFKPETWKALAQHLLPGAFIMAFGGSRTAHRLAIAMEDAGLIIHPWIVWVTGQSFPKATRVFSSSHEFCECDVTSHEEALGDSLPNDLGEKNTVQDCLDDYSVHPHPYGEPPHEAQESVRGAVPLLADAREHSHDDLRKDVQVSESANTSPCQDSAHPSTSNFSHHMKALHNYLSGGNRHHDRALSTLPVSQMARHRTVSDQLGKSDSDDDSASSSCSGVYTNISHCQVCRKPRKDIWDGHRYGLQSLKNAAEMIVVAQVPYRGRPVESITTHGSGALNIEAARLDGKRWPPNFALVHDSRCVRVGERQVKGAGWSDTDHGNGIAGIASSSILNSRASVHYTDATGHETIPAYECHPSCPVFLLDQQAGVRKAAPSGPNGGWTIFKGLRREWTNGSHYDGVRGYAHEGTAASRFFHVSDWSLDVAEQLAQAAPVRYEPKAPRSQRDAGLPAGQRNIHPTVKNLSLCKWLATLLLPPDAYAPRRILVPFCGVASEVIGAMLAGWDEIVGVEQDASYVEIANARLKYWSSQRKA